MIKTTHDDFLGGRLTLEQPAKGYRAGVDPVLLAASVPAVEGQQVLDLGCGVGAAMLCLGMRVPWLSLFGVELQSSYADLCRKNIVANGIEARVWTSDLRQLPVEITSRTFDHVIANPPYFERASGKASALDDREIAFAGETPLSDWIEVATRRLKPKGWLSMIQKADRLPDVLRAMDDRLGSISVHPIAARQGRAADRFILRARKGGMTPFIMHAPTHLHEGPKHLKDGDDYRPEIRAIFRNGAIFPTGD